ncbi:polysaccharide deacetylase family protein [Muricoccus radiodurans]|uniref:polysaccharide deacetylase family protein n=1 Tax=Muricoccus radiodurans TaxID=2231721 RepID=UPI003CF9558A
MRGRTVPRRVLALIDGRIETPVSLSAVHSQAALPLEWLGLTLRYHDVREPLPPVWDDPEMRGVLTWFPEPGIPDIAAFATWAERVVRSGRKLVVMGDLAPRPGTATEAAASEGRRRILALLGLSPRDDWSPITLSDRVLHMEEEGRIGFEHGLEEGRLPTYDIYEPTDPALRSWLVVERAVPRRASHVVAISPNGGFVAPGYAVSADVTSGSRIWRLDPFAFFEAAFDLRDLPRADCTTHCGRRIYYSHIDGDGWRSISQVRLPGGRRATTTEVILQRIIAPNPDLPISVAPIAADLTMPGAAGARASDLARALFALPQVEVTSHTYTHPFRWSFFADYTPEKERPYADAYRRMAANPAGLVESHVEANSGSGGSEELGAYAVPRAFPDPPYSTDNEVRGAARVIERLAPPGKRCMLVQWSGDCLPYPEIVAAAQTAGLGNINGGSTRFDDEFPTVGAVAPTGQFLPNGAVQVYASNSNENTYTELWTNRFFGFRDLPVTWERTGTPRRLKPMNHYYHMYSGERQASLDALVSNIAWLRTQEFIGLPASRFAAAARGTFTLRIREEGPDAWRLLDRGGLSTIRLRGTARVPDLAESLGVLGAREANGDLYVALDPEVEAPLLVLRPAGSAPVRPMLLHASWDVRALATSPAEARFRTAGLGSGTLSWHVPRAGTWMVADGRRDWPVRVAADLHLPLSLPPSATELTVSMRLT